MTWDGPNLPVDLTLTTASEPLTWTRSRLECSAWTLTALFAQVLTVIEPPKLFTSRRAPGPPRNLGAVWARPAAAPSQWACGGAIATGVAVTARERSSQVAPPDRMIRATDAAISCGTVNAK